MRRGFVLLETIVVISVLCIILITLYTGYNNTTNTVKTQLSYDNTEYIYKTYILKSYLEDKIINEVSYACSNCETVYIFCNDKTTSCSSIPTINADYTFLQSLITTMQVKAIYITKWDTSSFTNKAEIMNIFEATTQRYIKTLNPIKKDANAYRIIVMFGDENNSSSTIFQYASLGFESRNRSVSNE